MEYNYHIEISTKDRTSIPRSEVVHFEELASLAGAEVKSIRAENGSASLNLIFPGQSLYRAFRNAILRKRKYEFSSEQTRNSSSRGSQNKLEETA